MSFKTLIFVLISSLIVASCSEGNSKGPDSTGQGSEIIVVCNKASWDGPVGDTIRRALMRSMEGLSETEPEYTLIFIPENRFSKIQQTHRNVLIVDINPENKISRVETLNNIWAHPQRVFKIEASADTSFFRFFAEHSEAIKELYNQNERAIFTIQNALSRNTVVEKMLADEFGVQMVVSDDFYQAEKTTDLVHLLADTNDNSLSLGIYTFPFTDTSEINPNAVLVSRERFMRPNSSDQVKGAGIKYFGVTSRKILFKGMYALETRGLLKTKADTTGNPFINYTIVDAPRQRIVVFDGSVNYPYKANQNYIRQLEAIIWGAEFADPVKVFEK